MTAETEKGQAPEALIVPLDGVDLSTSLRTRAPGPGLVSRFTAALGRAVRTWGYASGLYRHRLKGRHPLQLLASPDDPAPGDASHGQLMLAGEIRLPSAIIPCDETLWRQLVLRAPADQRYGHSFHWLQDLAQVSDQGRATALAESLMETWLPFGDAWEPASWQAETLARRQINWLTHAPLILSKRDQIYKSKVLTVMAMQARHLTRVLEDAGEGLPRIYGATALTLSGLLLPGGKAWRNRGFKALSDNLASFLTADGGPRSRNPADAVKVMQQLILVRDAALEVNEDGPDSLQAALDKLAPFVRALRYTSGYFAQMNGASAEGGHGTDAVLAASEARGKALENMPHTGYQRVSAASALLIVDSGPPPPGPLSARAHSATGSFEFSDGRDRLFINMGHHTGATPMAALARTSAAHNMLVIGDRNATPLKSNGMLGSGMREVRSGRSRYGNGTLVCVTHDGYKRRFKTLTERRLWLSDDGLTLIGHDMVRGTDSNKLKRAGVKIRFHLNPQINIMGADDTSLLLTAPSGKVWAFAAEGATVEVEESLYLPTHRHSEASRQIVLTVTDGLSARWQLARGDQDPDDFALEAP